MKIRRVGSEKEFRKELTKRMDLIQRWYVNAKQRAFYLDRIRTEAQKRAGLRLYGVGMYWYLFQDSFSALFNHNASIVKHIESDLFPFLSANSAFVKLTQERWDKNSPIKLSEASKRKHDVKMVAAFSRLFPGAKHGRALRENIDKGKAVFTKSVQLLTAIRGDLTAHPYDGKKRHKATHGGKLPSLAATITIVDVLGRFLNDIEQTLLGRYFVHTYFEAGAEKEGIDAFVVQLIATIRDEKTGET